MDPCPFPPIIYQPFFISLEHTAFTAIFLFYGLFGGFQVDVVIPPPTFSFIINEQQNGNSSEYLLQGESTTIVYVSGYGIGATIPLAGVEYTTIFHADAIPTQDPNNMDEFNAWQLNDDTIQFINPRFVFTRFGWPIISYGWLFAILQGYAQGSAETMRTSMNQFLQTVNNEIPTLSIPTSMTLPTKSWNITLDFTDFDIILNENNNTNNDTNASSIETEISTLSLEAHVELTVTPAPKASKMTNTSGAV